MAKKVTPKSLWRNYMIEVETAKQRYERAIREADGEKNSSIAQKMRRAASTNERTALDTAWRNYLSACEFNGIPPKPSKHKHRAKGGE